MRAGVMALLVAILAACGSNQTSPAGPAPADKDEDAAAPSPQEDAGPDPHDIYPADHPPFPTINFFGGRVLASAKIVAVTFEGMDSGVRDWVRDFDAKIGASAYWKTALDGYAIGPATSGGAFELPDTVSGKTIDDSDVAALVASAIASGALPAALDDAIYVVHMPVTTTVTLDGVPSCSAFFGYHSSSEVVSEAGKQRFLYAVIAQCVAKVAGATTADIENEQTETTAHELTEVVTDPDINAPGVQGSYYMVDNDAWASSRVGGEVGDLCDNAPRLKEGAWSVPRIWNAKAAKASLDPCQPTTKDVFYAAVPHTVIPAKTAFGGPNADGYIVAKKGETTNIEVDVFSTAPLPSPLTLVATKSRFASAATDPTLVSQVAKGVTMTWSQPTARNGDKPTLAIAVDPSAASTTGTRFVIRAVASQTDYTNWPVVLRIP